MHVATLLIMSQCVVVHLVIPEIHSFYVSHIYRMVSLQIYIFTFYLFFIIFKKLYLKRGNKTENSTFLYFVSIIVDKHWSYIFADITKQPCTPSPCGPNSICKVVNDHAVCSCQPGLIGNPPACKPECIVSADCPLTQACLNNKCQDPCPGTCGQNTNCQVVNHNPICSCSESYTGDPFTICYPQPSK